jgi:hypothetical protein
MIRSLARASVFPEIRGQGSSEGTRMMAAARALPVAALGALLLALAGCAADRLPAENGQASAMRCDAPARPMVRLELVFGMSRPDGRRVSEAEWLDFLDGEVTPRFPSGLTVLSAVGQWRHGDGRTAREPSRVLLVLHEQDDHVDPAVEAIRGAYRRRFEQESVMRIESASCVSF